MKKSEVVFELVLLPPSSEQAALGDVAYVQGDFIHLKPPAERLHEWNRKILTRTHVRVRNTDNLLWVVRAIDSRLWGLVGKNRFYLYHFDSEQFYPVLKKEQSAEGQRWRLNDELIPFFQGELQFGNAVTKKNRKALFKRVSKEASEVAASISQIKSEHKGPAKKVNASPSKDEVSAEEYIRKHLDVPNSDGIFGKPYYKAS